MKDRFYKAFTLIEMLIVMGIIIILVSVGVAGTRYALNSANKIKHQNSVDNINQAILAYYADNREYPAFTNFGVALSAPDGEGTGQLYEYLEEGEFDGGADATYFYWLEDNTQQSFLVCVSLGGIDDANQMGFYCNGNAFGSDSGILDQDIEATGTAFPVGTATDYNAITDWSNEDNSFE